MRLVALFCRTPSPAACAHNDLEWVPRSMQYDIPWTIYRNVHVFGKFTECEGVWGSALSWMTNTVKKRTCSQMQFTFLPTKRHWIGHTNSSNGSTSNDALSARIPGSVAEKFQWFWTKPSIAYLPHSQAHHLAPCIYANSCIHSTIASFRLFFILITFKFATFVPSWRVVVTAFFSRYFSCSLLWSCLFI